MLLFLLILSGLWFVFMTVLGTIAVVKDGKQIAGWTLAVDLVVVSYLIWYFVR